jgi:hypothetical protein
MYKSLVVIVFVAITIASSADSFNRRSYEIRRLPSIADKSEVGLDLCPECINEAVAAINVLGNLILDQGIIGSCGDLCGALANKTGSKEAGVVCDVVCTAFGIDEFVKLLIKTDLDPIWYCQIAKFCPSKKKHLVHLHLMENLNF